VKNGCKPTISRFRKLLPALALLLSACGDSRQDEAVRFFKRANFLAGQREYRQAIQFYTEAIGKQTDFADAYNNRGLAHQSLNQWKEAARDFDEAIRHDPAYEEAYYNRARARFELGQPAEGLADLRRIEETYRDSAFFQVTRGDLLTLQRDYSGAYAAYNRALQLDSRHVEALVNRGALYYTDRRYAEARRDFEAAVRLNPNQHFALNNLALLQAGAGDYEAALRSINRAITLKPGQAFYLNNKGYILLELNQLEAGLSTIESSLRLNDRNGWAYRNRAIHALKTNQPDRALPDLQRAEALDPNIEGLAYYLGTAHFQLQQLPEACTYWQRGARLGETRATQMAARYCRR
jgi:tetratricopeptide (TPR) repeat protein